MRLVSLPLTLFVVLQQVQSSSVVSSHTESKNNNNNNILHYRRLHRPETTTATTTTSHIKVNVNNDNQLSSSSSHSYSARRSLGQTSQAEQELRRILLENYDKGTFPFSNLWETTTPSNNDNNTKNNNNNNSTTDQQQQQQQQHRTGLPVQVGLNFHRVLSVDVTSSVVDLIVWVRQKWHDPRLAWNTTNNNNTNIEQQQQSFAAIDKLNFWVGEGMGAGGEMSEIWTPDLQLWNLQEPLANTLADAYAVVSSDGTVFWSRPGHVKTVCKFKGLDEFPFDTLECTIEIGSWAYSGLYLRPVKMDGVGYSIGGSETAGEAFQEFALENVVCEEHVYPPYPNAPEEDWPVLFYHVTFRRAWEPYVRGFLILQIILNLAAFCCFWLPPHIGERMSLAITSVLAAVASELVVAAKLPAASEVTWFSKFSLMSLIFTALALFESAAVIYFYYYTGEDLVPRWYRWTKKKVCQGKRTICKHDKRQVRFSQFHSIGRDNGLVENGRNTEAVNANDKDSHTGDDTNQGRESQEDETSKLKSEPDDSEQNHAPEGSSRSELTDGEAAQYAVNRQERFSFSQELKEEMSSLRARKTIKTILGRDADDFKNAREMENNVRWQKVAATIDEVARVAFPVALAIFLSCTFASLAD